MKTIEDVIIHLRDKVALLTAGETRELVFDAIYALKDINYGQRKVRCRKCRSDDIHQRFRRKGEHLDSDWFAFTEAERDLIRSYCRNCGYRWSDLPRDTATAAPEADTPTT